MLATKQSLYHDSGLTVNINGKIGKTVISQIGVKQGCPLSPTLFGLYIDGMHYFLMTLGPLAIPVLSSGMKVPDLAYADTVAPMASSPEGVWQLLDLVCDFYALIGMIVSVPKTKVLLFNVAFPGPLLWTCGDEQLEIVTQYKYLGIVFDAMHGMAVTFPSLKQEMFGAWALLKRQYGRLQCLTSIGLMFRVYEACVPPSGAYACEIWCCQRFTKHYSALTL